LGYFVKRGKGERGEVLCGLIGASLLLRFLGGRPSAGRRVYHDSYTFAPLRGGSVLLMPSGAKKGIKAYYGGRKAYYL